VAVPSFEQYLDSYLQYICLWDIYQPLMVLGRTLQKALENFFKSPVVQDSRCQVLLPNGEFYDITGAKLLENKIIGSKETHRLVFLCEKEKSKMGKVIRMI
jgi:hypothetical protein